MANNYNQLNEKLEKYKHEYLCLSENDKNSVNCKRLYDSIIDLDNRIKKICSCVGVTYCNKPYK